MHERNSGRVDAEHPLGDTAIFAVFAFLITWSINIRFHLDLSC